jgi:DNA-directed RNA polymerase specialized sigma24 family protein
MPETKKKRRKKIFYLDFYHIEYRNRLNDMELQTREMLLTRQGWDRMVFWMDMEASLATLTPAQRESFVLHFIQGYTDREIAAIRGCAQPPVARQLKAAVKK